MSIARLPRPAISNPRPRLWFDGTEAVLAAEQLISLEVREQAGGLAALEMRLSNFVSRTDGSAGYAFEDEAEIALGSRLRVAIGPQSEQQTLFEGVVTALEAEFSAEQPPELVVLAEDALQGWRMTRRSHSYADMSPAEVVRAIAQRQGLPVSVAGLDAPVATWVQFNESDLAFLRRLLRGLDAELQLADGRLAVMARADMQHGPIELTLLEDLRQVRLMADLAHQVTAVTSSGWNPDSGRAVSGRGSGGDLAPGRGRSGAELLRQALGERVEHIGQVAVTSDEEAQALAEAVFNRRARAFVTAEGTADGHPAIRVGSHVALRGLSSRFENTYFVVACHHRYDVQQGYVTDFRAECAWLGEAS